MTSLSLLQRFIALRYDYTDPTDRQRARLLLYLLTGAILLAGVLMIRVMFFTLVDGQEINPIEFVPALPLLASFGLIYMVQTGYVRLAAVIAVTVIFVNNMIVAINLSLIQTPLFILLLIPITLAVVLFDRRPFNITLGLSVMAIILIDTLQSGNLGGFLSDGNSAGAFLIFVVVGLILSASSNSLRNIASANIDEIQRYHVVAGFSGGLGITSDNRVLGRMIEVIRSEMRYAFAQVFLVDERGQMTRRFRTGLNLPEGGVVTDIRLPDASALIESYQADVSLLISTQENPGRWEHFLPATSHSLAIPLRLGDQIIGVVDIQKTEASFNRTEIAALERLTQQAGTLLAYSRTVEDLRASVDNLQTTSESLRTQLRELKQTERNIISATWENYLDMRSRTAVGYDLKPEGIVLAADLPEDLLSVMRQGEVDMREEGGVRSVRVPIIVRGEVLGAMSFVIPADQPFGARQMEFARSVTVRLGLALENKRLLEASRAQAVRERKAGEVASTLIGATDVNDVVQLAAQSFNDALGAVATRIVLDRKMLDDDFFDDFSSSIDYPVSTNENAEEEATS